MLCIRLASLLMFLITATAWGETPPLSALLERADPADIAAEARRRGDPIRGALVYFTSAAGCVQCHESTADPIAEQNSPLGPDLSRLGEGVTDVHLVEALLQPSKFIREGFGTVQVLTVDGAKRTCHRTATPTQNRPHQTAK